jgi:hypothetical protein
MTNTFDQGKEEITRLCRYFATNHQAFLAPGVKEDHVRQSLIDPLFEALGWDVHNKARTAPQYQEVIPEDSLDVEGQQKAPDYTFRVGLLPKFYAEAKRCGVNIGADPGPAYQLRRYGWSAKLALSVLTDFEELGVYDCTTRPRPSDKASHARIQYFRFDEYPDRWRELWDVFSREAVWSGAFDQYAASKRKRGTSEVDAEFLKEMEGWRLALAGNIALRNKGLSLDDLNAAVQLTIDRVVFLRMAEDRGLESNEQLLKLCERPDIYPRFMHDLCRQADQKYNSGLFHFQKESGVPEDPDRITPRLAVDDKVFKPILESLYFAHGSPYHFGVLPVEILGTVYERFLGKVIRLTPGHQAKVEEKPEVRKAGGVYYTPAYIVEYIIKHTVGRQIERRSPAQLAGSAGVLAGSSGRRDGGATFRVLDMACGSGSFLLGAYRCLLDYCLNWYIEHKPENFKKAVYQDPRNGHWRLTIEERKRILTTHIFGVDIDLQAVEVTKLSLLLKVLEGETDQSLSLSQLAFGDRALPNLADNIKCGNSLIGPDYFTGKLIADPEEMKRVNPFDWKQRFPDAMKAGGFDCIIGNPPYIRIHNLVDFYPGEVRFIQERYETAQFGKVDIYVAFIERGLELLTTSGWLGFIVPNKFMQTDYGVGIRTLLARRKALTELVDFGNAQVFDAATTYTCLLFLTGSSQQVFRATFNRSQQTPIRFLTEASFEKRQASAFGPSPWQTASFLETSILAKLEGSQSRLSDVLLLGITGVKTGANSVFVFETIEAKTKTTRLRPEDTDSEVELETDYLLPYIKAESLKRYHVGSGSRVLLYPYQLSGGQTCLVPESKLKKCPKTWKYLLEHNRTLEGRQKGKLKGPNWYGLSFASSLQMFAVPKIVTPTLSPRNSFALDTSGYVFPQGAGGGCGLVPRAEHSAHYLLGLLNSCLLTFYFQRISSPFQGGWFAYEPRYLNRIPIRLIDKTNPLEKATHDRMVKLVDSMLALHKQLAAAKSEAQKAIMQRQIDATDAEIDRLVYDLYGLTAEEIAIVEDGG